MAHQNKNKKKTESKKLFVSQRPHRWLLLILISGIVVVSYAVVEANREPVVDVAASEGTATRDVQLQEVEFQRESALLNSYDDRYSETVLLDSSSINAVLKASTHDSL